MIVDHEEIEVLAFRMYKQNEPLDKLIWKLAELCLTISININGIDEDSEKWGNVNAFKTVEELSSHLKYDHIKEPSEEEIKRLSEKLESYDPEKSKLHWYISEKTIILNKLKQQLQKD